MDPDIYYRAARMMPRAVFFLPQVFPSIKEP